MTDVFCSKFFGQPNSAKAAPPKQSKLSFASKPNATNGAGINDVDMKDEAQAIKKEEPETKGDLKPATGEFRIRYNIDSTADFCHLSFKKAL